MKFIVVTRFVSCSLLIHVAISSTVFISDFGMSKMIELSTKSPYCVVQIDRGKIRDKLLASDPRRVRKMSDESVENLIKVCNKSIQSPHQGGFIYPGTKWCGPGNKARDYSDLGFHSKEDICCREHDMCPKSLSKGECKQGICNNSLFTRSHCDCDAAFRKCLQNVNTETANTIGAIFFNIVQVICFKERTPCTQWQRNGYTKAEGDALCSQIHFRPSEKYVPLMPLP
ncbi:group 3 secretory phospholipase A2-like [Diorhabda sublineata]|uniref:group 3 secretory phospholipase A2-like n=1 Tax=Diorhabda sublineata TaxID=1163346 RepID=UPI0024E15C85|nr:group 3 secretory phospholipase A2-like [Diorhabda sublineata]